MTPAKGHNCHLLIHACYRWSLGTLTVGDSQKAAKSKPVHDAGFKSQLCYCCLARSCLSHLGYRNRLHEFPSAVSAAEWSRLSEIQVKEVSALQFDSKWSSSGDTDLPLSLGTVSHDSGPLWQSTVDIKEHCQEILFLCQLYFLRFFHKRTPVFLVR